MNVELVARSNLWAAWQCQKGVCKRVDLTNVKREYSAASVSAGLLCMGQRGQQERGDSQNMGKTGQRSWFLAEQRTERSKTRVSETLEHRFSQAYREMSVRGCRLKDKEESQRVACGNNDVSTVSTARSSTKKQSACTHKEVDVERLWPTRRNAMFAAEVEIVYWLKREVPVQRLTAARADRQQSETAKK